VYDSTPLLPHGCKKSTCVTSWLSFATIIISSLLLMPHRFQLSLLIAIFVQLTYLLGLIVVSDPHLLSPQFIVFYPPTLLSVVSSLFFSGATTTMAAAEGGDDNESSASCAEMINPTYSMMREEPCCCCCYSPTNVIHVAVIVFFLPCC